MPQLSRSMVMSSQLALNTRSKFYEFKEKGLGPFRLSFAKIG